MIKCTNMHTCIQKYVYEEKIEGVNKKASYHDSVVQRIKVTVMF